jgi:transcription elongation factor GreA
MSDKTQYLTQASLESLQTELEQLKNVKIPEIANKIDEAKQQGDLSENAEYHSAKEDMAWAQGRFMELENLLSNAVVIGSETKGEGVSVGQTVVVEVGGKTKEYTIVGPQEADPFAGKISNESPLGQAFLGRSKGDEVEVQTPAGKQVYAIMSIKR